MMVVTIRLAIVPKSWLVDQIFVVVELGVVWIVVAVFVSR